MRKALVLFQFIISTTLIMGAIIINQQTGFIQNARLGLNKDNVININDTYYLDSNETANLKNEWLQVKGVRSVSSADGMLIEHNWSREVKYKGAQNDQSISYLSVDTDFIGSLNMQFKEGRNFLSDHFSDSAGEVILNETAVRQLGIPNPVIGQQILWHVNPQTKEQFYATIVGVLRDFHFSSVKTEIKPFALVPVHHRKWDYIIKTEGTNTAQTISGIKNIWDKHVNSRPFEYTFLDETYARLYSSEMNFKKIFMFTTCLAIFISCLGLFGLSSFIMEQRSKEIGIRKVLGASVSKITGMLSREFLNLIIISSLISFPLSWWIMDSWLQNFAYRITMDWRIFFLAGLLSLFIALLTIGFQAIKAAVSNPIKRLKTE